MALQEGRGRDGGGGGRRWGGTGGGTGLNIVAVSHSGSCNINRSTTQHLVSGVLWT